MSEPKKLTIDGCVIKGDDAPVASYKSIPENPDIKKSTTSLSKREKGDFSNDGAAEKLLAKEDEAKGNSGNNMAEVKFIAGDQLNGDAKVEIETSKQVFSGLTKEELMKFANDPFWIRLRWCMFILFWALWLSMLAGAIAIVIGAPKCAPPPPKTWWEQGPLIEPDQSDFISLEADLPVLEKAGVVGVFIPDNNADSYEIILQSTENKTNLYKSLAEKAKEKGIRLIVDLTANYVQKSSEWFTKSELKEEPYTDYFIWADSKDINPSGEKIPPNNWISTLNESAWTYSNLRKQFYLHQFESTTPDLNFRNPKVVKEFDKVINQWTSVGISGVRLSKIKHLLVDQDFKNESFSSVPGAIHTDYAFYNHARTTHQSGLGDILAHWRAVLRDNTAGEGLFTSKERIDMINGESYRVNGTHGLPIDIPRTHDLASSASRGAKLLADKINAGLKDPLSSVELWPSWQHTTNDKSIISELNILTQLLPGVPLVKLHQITTAGENSTLQPSKMYLELVSLREKPSTLYGSIQIRLLANDTVFAFTRLKSGNPGLIVVFNPTATQLVVDSTPFEDVPAELTVHIISDNYNVTGVTPRSKVSSNALPVSPKSVIVLTYVPKKDE